MIMLLWFVLFSIFVGSYLAFFAYLYFQARKPWRLKLDPQFRPSVTVLVAAHNEEAVIEERLRNIAEVTYPKDKMEIVFIDDSSTDRTLSIVNNFMNTNPGTVLKVMKQHSRSGKAKALNLGLSIASGEMIVTTDADVLWPQDILSKALPYLADPTVGAISGRAVLTNPNESWVTQGEQSYLGLMSSWRLGESKIHSTLRFEGCFSIFRKQAFAEFDTEIGPDDSATALRIVQNKYRTVLVPEAHVSGEMPGKMKSRTKIKLRRAGHLTALWFFCLKLLLRRQLLWPKRIAIPEIFLSIFGPIIFVALVAVTAVFLVYYPIVIVPLILFLCAVGLIPDTQYLIQAILDQFTLFCAICLYATKRKYTMWNR